MSGTNTPGNLNNDMGDPSKPEGTIYIVDKDNDTVYVEEHISSMNVQFELPVLPRGNYNLRVIFVPDTFDDDGTSVVTHDSSYDDLLNTYIKGYDSSISFVEHKDGHNNAYAITLTLRDTRGVLANRTVSVDFPDGTSGTYTTDANGEVYIHLLYNPTLWEDVVVEYAGESYVEPCSAEYEAGAGSQYVVGEGMSFADDAHTISFVSGDWNKTSTVSIPSGTLMKLGTTSTNQIVVYQKKKLLRGDTISVRLNPTGVYNETYWIGLSSVNSTTVSLLRGGHIASLYRGGDANQILTGTGFSVLEACSERLGTCWEPVTFFTDNNNQVVVDVNGERHYTGVTLPEGGAYLFIHKGNTSMMLLDGLVYAYQQRGLTDWTERIDYSSITPHRVSDWRQYNGSSLTMNNMSTGNLLNVLSGHKIVYPVNLGGNFSLSVKLGNNGATSKSYWFGIYGGCPSNPVNNFNTGMLTGIQYYNGALYVLNSAIEINNWELENTLKQVDIIYDGNSITYKFYNSSGSVVKTVSQAGQFGTDCYFALYNGCNANITISDFKVSIEHNINDTRTRNDFVSIEGAPVSDTSLPQTLFSDSNYLKTQSESLLGESNGERLWLQPSNTSQSDASIFTSKYVVIHRGEAVEISIYIYANDINYGTTDMRVGLSSNNRTSWSSIKQIVQYFQRGTGIHTIIADNTSDQTTTKTLGPVYKWVKFVSDDDGIITVSVDGESHTTNARVPEAGAYLFVTNYRQSNRIGIMNIRYHSYGGGGQ